MPSGIDIHFDFRSDTPPGRDPDALSPTLHRYHQLLWSKPLPGGEPFTLQSTRPSGYLSHRSELGAFFLSSDSVIPTFCKEKRLAAVFAEISPEEREAFEYITYTIGGMMVFPSNVVDRKMTINGARGCHPLIKDRFDLTVECIRRHYLGEQSPLSATLARYTAFFDLFKDFKGYVDFFLLQDLVTSDYSGVRFHLPFAGLDASPLPAGLDEYLAYMRSAAQFVHARNERICRADNTIYGGHR